MMKQLIWLCTLLIVVGCTEEAIENTPILVNEEFYATIENEHSRTYVDEQIRMRWHEDDCITIFKKETYNREFKFTGKTGANAGGFTQISVDDEFYSAPPVNANYAVYPHSKDTELDETDCFFTLSIPAEQTYAENSFGLNANTMVAVSQTGNLMFKNVGSYLRVRLHGENTAISSITLTTKGDEAISGKAKVTPIMDGDPTCEMIGVGKSIRLVCDEPVIISSDSDAPTDFWIVVPPVTLDNGFSVMVENDKGDTQTFNIEQSFSFERNLYYNLIREVQIKSDIPYVTFNADATQTLTMSKAVETIEYSVNGNKWTELGTSTVTFGGKNGALQLRGKNSNGTAESSSDYSQITFGNDNPVTCNGDIRTLVNYENYLTVNTENARFCNLFAQCSVLTTSPSLPATILADDCYYKLFENCTNLTTAPQLPANTLSDGCYFYMFSGCAKLTATPKLPATKLANKCYYGMFTNCTKLVDVSKLPATTLNDECYFGMFRDCTELATTPELPATALAPFCYGAMFSGCTKLTTAPELPATTLAESCYDGMFSKCTKLIKAPKLPATIMHPRCYWSMFFGCIELTEAPELPATTLAEQCYMAMFQECTGLTKAPELPATTMANSCYSHMFMSCSGLLESPVLPAKTLAANCYDSMLRACYNLNKVTMLATDISASDCLIVWLSAVSSTGTFVKAKEMELLPQGINGIPEGWEVINYEE